MNPKVTIFTDGACSGNPGPGGWGAILLSNGTEKQINGGFAFTTNNRMELTAVLEALKALKKPCNVAIYTDSSYVQSGITKYIHTWKKNGWVTSARKEVKNRDLWTEIDQISATHEINWYWVKGHAGNEGNEKVDKLAREGMKPYLPVKDKSLIAKNSTE